MKHTSSLVFVFVTLILLISSAPTHVQAGGEGGGIDCAACTGLMTLVLDLAAIHNQAVDKALEDYCTILPRFYQNPCINFLSKYGTELIQLAANNASPDDICHGLGVCTLPSCRLFPGRHHNNQKRAVFSEIKKADSAWSWLIDAINRFANLHEPMIDTDGDLFSDIETFRGSNWRGKDCDPLSNQVYPGRKSTHLTPEFDHNCNGISGVNSQGNSWEDVLCGSSEPLGVINLGDSATAHFRIPPNYINASAINKNTYDHALFLAEDELDWPHRSWGTGFANDTTGDCQGPLESIYLQMRQRNLCNHRDYQNIGVNGARSGSMAPPGIIYSMARNQTIDNPALVFYALIGNDVCHGENTTSVFTTPAQFETNVLAALSYLDTVLPSGSHVVFVGLVDGRVLWDTMHARIHPLGCTYEELYDFLNCLQISPCWGWLNSNGTVRNETSAAAKSLNQVYTQIIQNYSYKNFDMVYYDFPLALTFAIWHKMGGQAWQLIEPSDGFHPDQNANAIVAKILFERLLSEHPDFVGPVNPNNQQILQLFGDQGGY